MKFLELITLLCLAEFSFCASNSLESYVSYQPEQVHIALGDSHDQMVITWSTMQDPGESIVEYGIGGYILTKIGSSKIFVDGGPKKHFQHIHKVVLDGLQPNSSYVYHVGSHSGWSPQFYFKTLPLGNNWSPQIAIFGDMGNENAQSLTRLQEEAQRGDYDTMIHVGDFAYDMNTDNAEVGDQFMNQIQSVAAYVPYMVCPGNHEEKYNFSNYRARFNMPGGSDSGFYSFNLGPVHFIAFSSEFYYFMNYGFKSLVFQYEWLEKDLKEATRPENRKLRPWIIVFAHRPMYCSNNNGDDCTHHETLTRVGLPFAHLFALEPLFYKYGVDVEIYAHEHSYERLWPIYDYKVRKGGGKSWFVRCATLKKNRIIFGVPKLNFWSDEKKIHIVTGSAGCKEGREPFPDTIPEWSAFHSRDYGYTILNAHNATHLEFRQISDDQDGAVIDHFFVIRDKHGAYKN